VLLESLDKVTFAASLSPSPFLEERASRSFLMRRIVSPRLNIALAEAYGEHSSTCRSCGT
jgi:hypothetical protein